MMSKTARIRTPIYCLLGAAVMLTAVAAPKAASAASRKILCTIKGVKEPGGSPTSRDGQVILHNSTGRTITGPWKIRWLFSDGRSGWFNGNQTVPPGQWMRIFHLSTFGYPWCVNAACSNLGLQCKAAVYFKINALGPSLPSPRFGPKPQPRRRLPK